MIISGRADPTSTSAASYPTDDAPAETPLPASTLLPVKIYAFGGMAVVITIILVGIAYWIWMVNVKGKSPSWFKTPPEPKGEDEDDRVARLEDEKAESMLERKRGGDEEEDLRIPPVRYERNAVGRDRSCSLPTHLARKHGEFARNDGVDRKSSLSTSPSRGKRVSWASSISTLDGRGNASEKPLSPHSSRKSSFHPIPSNFDPPSPVPVARTYTPRPSTPREPRSRRGSQMMDETTPDAAYNWMKPYSYVRKCSCREVGPLDVTHSRYCEMYADRD